MASLPFPERKAPQRLATLPADNPLPSEEYGSDNKERSAKRKAELEKSVIIARWGA